MKRTKTLFLLLTLLLCTVPMLAERVTKTIHLDAAGTLSTQLTKSEKSSITQLTVTGVINQQDFDAMRSMANLTEIDLLGCAVVRYSSCPANEIPRSAFSGKQTLTSFVFPSGITSIDDYAFNGCSGFTGTLTLPSGLTSIGNRAFLNCSSFTGTLTLPSGLTSIEDNAFCGCSGFTGTLTLPSDLTFIGGEAFAGCARIDNVVATQSTPCGLGYKAFPSNKVVFVPRGSLEAYKADSNWSSYLLLGEDVEATIHLDSPNTLAQEVISAGYHPAKITRLILSGEVGDEDWTLLKNNFTQLYYLDMSATTVTTIPNNAFSDNKLLQCYLFPSSVVSIGRAAFDGCSGFTGTLTFPSGLTSIGDDAFRGCSGFTGTLTLPSSLTSIGHYTFLGCSGFTGALVLPSGLTSIGNRVFLGCSGFTGTLTLPSGLTSIREHAFNGCSGFTGTLTLPSGLTSIGNSAFRGCSGFTGTLTLSSDLISIGSEAFWSCSGFTGTLTLPSGLTSIGDDAFNGCRGFTGTLTLPSGLTSLGNSAFRGCRGFTGTLTLSSDLVSIGSYAFWGCSGFSSLLFEDGVTSVPNAFDDCTGITTLISYSTTPPTCASGYFDALDKETCLLQVPSNAVMAYLTAPEWGTFTQLTGVEVPNAPCIAKLNVGSNGNVVIKGASYNKGIHSLEVVKGDDFTFTVTPNNNCAVVRVVLDGENITDQLVENQYTISNVQENFALSVEFKELPTFLSLSMWEQGAVWVAVEEGSSLSLRIVPASGWIVNSVSYNGVEVSGMLDAENNYTTPAIANGDALVVTYQEVGSLSVEEATATTTPIKVYASAPTQIAVKGVAAGDEVALYTLSGTLVAQRKATDSVLYLDVEANTLYVVRVNGYIFKLAL